MEGLIFGLVDNGLVVLGGYLGVDIEDRIANKFNREANPVLGAVIGAGVTNLFSDAMGCLLDPAMTSMVYGVMLGCLLPLLCIPFIERARTWWRSRNNDSDTENNY